LSIRIRERWATIVRVLIAEDNALLAFMIEEALTDEGHAVIGPASQYDAAMRLAESNRPDLALVDIDLEAGRSGIDLARELKARWGVHVLFVTGQFERARAHPEAALGVLTKPFSPAAVVASVKIVAEILQDGRPSSRRLPELELFGFDER
jgi:DNA-binding response OmpR family regulator